MSNLGVELPVPEGARLIRNDEPAGFAANANRGIAETAGEFVVVCNPDTEADPGALAVLQAFAEFHPANGDRRPGAAQAGRLVERVSPALPDSVGDRSSAGRR